jgi:hypothetical protein
VPGAIAAGLDEALFWWSLAVSPLLAFIFAFPAQPLADRGGRGHAVVHEFHGH